MSGPDDDAKRQNALFLAKARYEAALMRELGPLFYTGLSRVDLDPRHAFLCWNILATVSDTLKDLRAGLPDADRQLSFGKYTLEELVDYVMQSVDPRAEDSR